MKKNDSPRLRIIILVILIFVLLLGSFTVLIHSAIGGNPFGADFYTFWLAGKSVFTQGQDPYSDAVTMESQLGIYKRLAEPYEDQVAFAYPPFSLLVLIPTAWMSFDWAQAFWMALNLLLLVTLPYFVFPKAPKWILLSFLFLYPVTFGLILGNFAVLIGLILITFYGLLLTNSLQPKWLQFIMGVAFAWITIKPQFIWLHMVFILLISLRLRLHSLFAGFLAGLVFVFGVSFLMVPAWPLEWARRAIEYSGYTKSTPTVTIFLHTFLPTQLATILTVILISACVLFTLWLFRSWWQERTDTLWLISWCGFLTYFVHPHYISYEQITFLIPLFLWAMLSKKALSLPLLIFWLGSLVLSWIIFTITKFNLLPVDANGWPVLFNLIWVIWLAKQRHNHQPIQVFHKPV